MSKRQLKRLRRLKALKATYPVNEILVHGYMVYKCEKCGRKWNMWLEKGIEEPGENHKPSPFTIACKCRGLARDISGLIKLPGYRPLWDNMSYFANREESDCGVPVLRFKESDDNVKDN